jgi:hypothetical protein
MLEINALIALEMNAIHLNEQSYFLITRRLGFKMVFIMKTGNIESRQMDHSAIIVFKRLTITSAV